MGIHISIGPRHYSGGGRTNPIVAGIILAIFGLIFLCAGVFMYSNTTKNKDNYRTTTATIVDVESYTEYDSFDERYETKYNVYVTYTIDDIIYENIRLENYNSSMSTGDVITITYDINNPDRPISSANTSFTMSLIIAITGTLITIIGIVMIVKRAKEIKNSKNYKESNSPDIIS